MRNTKKILVSTLLILVLGFILIIPGCIKQPIQGKCSDGICDDREEQKGICPKDGESTPEIETCGPANNGYCIDFSEKCKSCYEGIGPDKCRRGRSADCCVPIKIVKSQKACSEQGGTICDSSHTCSGSWLNASDNDRCCSGECVTSTFDYDDSPFGFHPGNANNYAYIQDLGSVWSREGPYIIWDWVDVNRSGNFKFTDATAPPKDGVPGSGGQINYDTLRLHTPEIINIMANVCPFRKGGEFADSQEKEIYYSFVQKMVERYDGDSDLGCTQKAPDCYNPGDNDYPSQEIIDIFKTNPITCWQVCNHVTDTCDGRDCKETYAQKFAEVQRITYQAVKEADNSASVLIAGDSQKELYSEVFQHLDGGYIDIIDFHRFGTEEDYNPKDDFEYLKASLQSAGFDLNELRFWITETGTYSGDPADSMAGRPELLYQSEKQQARGLFKRYVSARSYDIEKIFWAWNIVEGFKRDCRFFDYTGLVYDGCDCLNGKYVCQKGVGNDLGKGVKKLAYYTYKLMVEKLEGSDWDNIQTIQESDNVYVYKYTKKDSGEIVWVAWRDYFDDTGSNKTISLDVGDISLVKITEVVQYAEDGKDIEDNNLQYPNFFNIETKTVSNNQITITLGESPVFIEGIE